MNTSITLNIRKISNGYLASTMGMTLNGMGDDENYFATEGEMAEALPSLVARAFERAEAEMREMVEQRRQAMAQQQSAYHGNLSAHGIIGASDIIGRGN